MPDPVEIKPLKYRDLKRTHPEYDLAYWQDLRALYEGGKALLHNPEVFQRLFPRHVGETPESYQERQRRAFYVNHLGTVIDFIVAGLGQDPARISTPDAEGGQEAELEEFYADFQGDCSAPGGKKQPFDALLREQARTGLLLGRIWTLVDFPRAPEGYAAQSLADEVEAGVLDGYAVAIAPESVIDWEFAEDGGLLWAMQRECARPRGDLAGGRDLRRLTFTLWTREGWGRYVVEFTPKELVASGQVAGQVKPEPPDDEVIALVAKGDHSCGRVPLLLCEMPVGLWAGNKIHSLAVEYLNKSCGLSWAEYKSLYASLYEFLGNELPGVDEPISTAQQDPNRAERKKRGPGIVQVRGKDDRAEYVGPDTSGYAHSAETLKRLSEDIYRVTYQMALAEDNSGAAIRRSADSKKLDHSGTNVVLCAVGEHMRDHGTEVVETVEAGRGEDLDYVCVGMAKFDVVELAAEVEKAVTIETVSVPSATYQVTRKLELARADLGDRATPEVMAKIEKELRGAITQDQFEMAAMADVSTAAATAAVADATALGGDPAKPPTALPPKAKPKVAPRAPAKV